MKTKKLLLCTCLAGITGIMAASASATIISGTVTGGSSLTQGGTFIKLSVPFTESNPVNTVGNDTFQNPNLYGFDEIQNVYLASNLNVDVLANGLGGSSGSGSLAAGTTVASHYIFFDPNATTSQTGTVTFDSEILGILTSTNNLAASDYLVNPGVTYLNPTLRGLEAGDYATITGLDTINVNWTASTPGDYIRVLTAYSPSAVPVPAAIWLFGSGLLSLLGVARHKRC